MAPARTSNRRAHRDQHEVASNVQPDPAAGGEPGLFTDPMLGLPLQIYVDKDVENREHFIELVAQHGGVVSPGYSSVQWICVDPYKESGQSLYRQYAGKKVKVVLDARWVEECVNRGQLLTYQTNWGNCKVTGQEQIREPIHPPAVVPGPSTGEIPQVMPTELAHPMQPPSPQVLQQQAQAMPPPPISATPADQLMHQAQHAYPYPVYATPMEVAAGAMHPPTAAPPQSWQAANGIAPQQTHMQPPPPPAPHMIAYRDDQGWNPAYHQPPPPHPGAMVAPPGPEYDYRYREDQRGWVTAPPEYYQQAYEPPYTEPDAYMEEAPQAGPSNQEPSTPAAQIDKRGRKRARAQPQPAPPASTLVMNRRNPPTRSPTPPTRVIKSTYGGNLFTADDVMYLKRYIEYCQEQGLVLSLREICERIAVKAPHHTFYSWRRYCNKHQIRLGGYAMDITEGDGNVGDEELVQEDPGQPTEGSSEIEAPMPIVGAGPGTIAVARRAAAADIGRTRSPTPPRALFRSTTGKGVAFTEEDVTFLVRFLEYRSRMQGGKVDMVAFWKDVAQKAPHHSRASWMKFYRRHKHELHHTETDAPLPPPPEKKMRYSKGDDVLLAKYFFKKPEGTSDRIFQEFARTHSHHPWKGWQEHHRIHKAKIDHLIQRLGNGESIDEQQE